MCLLVMVVSMAASSSMVVVWMVMGVVVGKKALSRVRWLHFGASA